MRERAGALQAGCLRLCCAARWVLPQDALASRHPRRQRAQQIDEGDHSIGARITTLTPHLAKSLNSTRSSGVIINESFNNGPSQKAGVQANDIIVAIDGVPVRNVGEVVGKVRLTPIGQKMTVTIDRGAATQDSGIQRSS